MNWAHLYIEGLDRVARSTPWDPQHTLVCRLVVVLAVGVRLATRVVPPPSSVGHSTVAARPRVVVGVERRELHAERGR